jgi:protein ImuB
MRRVVSVWFPHWPTDRLRRHHSKLSADSLPRAVPLVTAMHDGRRRVIAAVDAAAHRIGLRPAMAMAHALAMVPDLQIADAEPAADAASLRRLALWCHRYTPLAAADTDGLWLDVSGGAHLSGGEAPLLIQLLDRLARDGMQARAAIADTAGAAHALARHGTDVTTLAPPGQQDAAIARLPVAALRLPPALVITLRRLGFERVDDLTRLPRAVLARRFGPLVGQQLDRAHGTTAEVLPFLSPEPVMQQREAFLEPLLTAEGLSIAISRLMVPLCAQMESAGLGARRLDLLFHRVDAQVVALRIGTVQPSRDATHLTRLLAERLDTVDPGMGVEAMQLIVPVAQPLYWQQQDSTTGPQDVGRLVDRLSSRLGRDRVYRAKPIESAAPEDIVGRAEAYSARSLKRCGTRQPLGGLTYQNGQQSRTESVKPHPSEPTPLRPARPTLDPLKPGRPAPALKLVASAEPEPGAPSAVQSSRPAAPLPRQALHLIPSPQQPVAPRQEPIVLPWKASPGPRRPVPLDERDAANLTGLRAWPSRLKVPARLLAPPCPVNAIAALPNQAPRTFTWRRNHRVIRAEGPERIHEVWWMGSYQTDAVRDYFQVEVEGGRRFWLFRQGDGFDLRTGSLQWFLHGVF